MQRQPWSLAASGAGYEIAYGRRGRREAARQWRFVRALSEFEGLPPGSLILDLGAGRGRLAAALAAEGLHPLAIDRSAPALATARRRGTRWGVRAELARLPLRTGRVQAAVALFSSLGHDGADQLARELSEVARALAPGAPVAVDLADPESVQRGLEPCGERRVGGLWIRERRRLTRDSTGRPRAVHKRVRLGRGGYEVARWHEHLPLWTPDEVLAAALAATLDAPRVLRGPALDGFGPGRLLLLARAPVGD
ncbi:MAG: methyltransferase domain-containing protein [Planctomycetota bacterium]